MTPTEIELDTWPRAAAYRLFRSYAQPHFALTARLDVTRLLGVSKPASISPFRACLYAIAAGFHDVPELLFRFRDGGRIVRHDRLTLSPTIALPDGNFGFGYVEFDSDWTRFDAAAKAEIADVRSGAPRRPNTGERDDLVYLSCLPWIDFTGLTNALPGPDDCIPRASWGRFVENGDRITCALTVEVHHAIADGAHVARAIAAAQTALDTL